LDLHPELMPDQFRTPEMSAAAKASASALPFHLVRPDDQAWEEWLAPVPRDIYHTAGFHRYAQGSSEGDPFLAVVGDHLRGLAWPYLVRSTKTIPGLEGSLAMDVNSVYGYPGPLAWGAGAGDPFLAAAFGRIVETWRDQGAVAAFTRFHPLLGNATLMSGILASSLRPDSSGGVVAGGQTVSVDLSHGVESARAGYGRGLGREIRNLRRVGMVTIHDEDWEHLSTFARLYRETMVRNSASQYYFFDEGDFRRLRDTLAGRLHLLVTLADNNVAAAALFTEFDSLAEWYLVATSAAFRYQSPGKLLLDDAIEWAHARGMSVMHLGGGRGGRDDTLLWSKGRFSNRRHAFHTGRWILNRAVYTDLVAARLAGLPPNTSLEAGYFPAYRAGISEHAHADRTPWPSMEIRSVTPREAGALGALLPRIDQTFFRPHPMTPTEASRISELVAKDVYLIGFANGVAVAYGMLRGWDEGYETPSIGIGIRRDMERHGYGRAMMLRLHELARERGAAQVRLRVHADNVGAAALYRELGYEEVGVERSEVLMRLAL
jgi:GNAT superfamily N-acetyltransferase